MLFAKDARFGGANRGVSGVSDRSVIMTRSRAERTSVDESSEETENEGEEAGMARRDACEI